MHDDLLMFPIVGWEITMVPTEGMICVRLPYLASPFEKLSEQQQKTLSEAESLRQKIQANPFNISDLAQLKILQSSLGRGPMVAYLDSRLTEMQKRGKSGN